MLLIQDLVERCQSILIGTSKAILNEENIEAVITPLEAALEESKTAAAASSGGIGASGATSQTGDVPSPSPSASPRFVSRERIVVEVSWIAVSCSYLYVFVGFVDETGETRPLCRWYPLARCCPPDSTLALMAVAMLFWHRLWQSMHAERLVRI